MIESLSSGYEMMSERGCLAKVVIRNLLGFEKNKEVGFVMVVEVVVMVAEAVEKVAEAAAAIVDCWCYCVFLCVF